MNSGALGRSTRRNSAIPARTFALVPCKYACVESAAPNMSRLPGSCVYGVSSGTLNTGIPASTRARVLRPEPVPTSITVPSSGCSRASAMRRSASGCAVCAEDDDMSAVPLVLVVGGDGLAIRVCEELLATHGHRAAVVWMHDADLGARLGALGEGCRYVPGAPNDDRALRDAGAASAVAIMVLSDDDQLNLQVALKARDLNPAIRIVMRQFS